MYSFQCRKLRKNSEGTNFLYYFSIFLLLSMSCSSTAAMCLNLYTHAYRRMNKRDFIIYDGIDRELNITIVVKMCSDVCPKIWRSFWLSYCIFSESFHWKNRWEMIFTFSYGCVRHHKRFLSCMCCLLPFPLKWKKKLT